MTPPKLKRELTLFTLTAYGLGTILGAGIYVLIGKIAGHAGLYAPFSFLIASIIAFFSAYSYAMLSQKFPKSGGEAEYVRQAFKRKWLSALTGWLIVFTGIISSATLVKGFVGYFQVFFNIETTIIIIGLLIFLLALAIKGIKESAFLITFITAVELLGLIIVIYYGQDALMSLPQEWPRLIPKLSNHLAFNGIFIGAFIAFYAFIGFEDMVNIAEEVKSPEKTLPKAIFISLLLATILYMLIAIIAVLSLPLEDLANSSAPLALILSQKTTYGNLIISGISLLAIVNGALVQLIMGSRILYGMAQYGEAPKTLSTVNAITQTPIYATLFIGILSLALTLWLPIETLAKSTSFIILTVFTLINLSLIMVRKHAKERQNFMPYVGAILCSGLLFFQIYMTVSG